MKRANDGRKAARARGARFGRKPKLNEHQRKEAIRRLLHAGLPSGDDLVRASYGSADFHAGVRAFIGKSDPIWTGK